MKRRTDGRSTISPCVQCRSGRLHLPARARLHQNVHILIDCGNKFGKLDLLGERIAELKKDLPRRWQWQKAPRLAGRVPPA